ncbi:Reverse transcriptase, related [Eimeria mitis]|uniref:Reverse transcriptase, related n=1 Tax=Eimeria mitis TaxID=44415 RepID=U6KIT0_9EIME|nr:Reverse transcriptase, related [Eimeria mitis]CDJ36187.1 Reverse transcriptase, related [Eimeria mitis]
MDIESPPREIAGHFPEPRRTRSQRESGPTVSRKGSTSARNQDLDAEGTSDPEKTPSKWEIELLMLLRQMADESRANSQKEGSNRRGIAATEDGTNMRAFLCIIEQEIRELTILDEQWGLELRKYLTGKAMAHWELMQRSGTEISDWQHPGLVIKGDERARPEQLTGGNGGQAATGQIAITVSPNRGLHGTRSDVMLRTEEERKGNGQGKGDSRPLRRVRLLSGGTVRGNGVRDNGGEVNGREGSVVRDNGGEVNERGGTAFGGTGNGVNECTGGHENTMDGGSIHGGASIDAREQRREERSAPADGEGKREENPTSCGDEGTTMIPGWLLWQEGDAAERTPEYHGSLCSVGKTAVLQLEIVGHKCEGLLDTGASRSFIRLNIVERLGLRVRILQEAHSFTAANGEVILIDWGVPRLSMLCGGEYFTGDFLVGPIPEGEPTVGTQTDTEPIKTAADHAHDDLAKQVARMSAEEAAALLRPPTKRYKSKHRAGDRVKIKDILREARGDTAALKRAIEGLHCVVALPAAKPDCVVQVPIERQGPLLCAIVEHQKVTHFEPGAPPTKPIDTAPPTSEDIDDSPWPTAKLQYTEFDAWSNAPEALRLPTQILTVLKQHRLLFPDSLPDGLPPKRPYDHRILLLPGRLPTRAPIYKMPPDQLAYHTKEIAHLTAKGWIGRTYSPICAPTIMVDKRDDGRCERSSITKC